MPPANTTDPLHEVVIIVVDGLDLEAGRVVRLEGGQAAVGCDLERAGLALRKTDVNVLLLAH